MLLLLYIIQLQTYHVDIYEQAEWHDHRMELNAGRDEEKEELEAELAQRHGGTCNES